MKSHAMIFNFQLYCLLHYFFFHVEFVVYVEYVLEYLQDQSAVFLDLCVSLEIKFALRKKQQS